MNEFPYLVPVGSAVLRVPGRLYSLVPTGSTKLKDIELLGLKRNLRLLYKAVTGILI